MVAALEIWTQVIQLLVKLPAKKACLNSAHQDQTAPPVSCFDMEVVCLFVLFFTSHQ